MTQRHKQYLTQGDFCFFTGNDLKDDKMTLQVSILYRNFFFRSSQVLCPERPKGQTARHSPHAFLRPSFLIKALLIRLHF